ncbi:MAG: hypothetical protein HFH97_14845 [Lachnospiraceae bacterium]|nr:hypothetical protein [Lachnospiraceae bacterium]
MKSRRVGLSSFIYTEWLRPIADYYLTIKINEAMFEIILPAIAAVVCTCLYYIYGDVNCALRALADLLPTAISILIGFTVMLITLLLTSSGENIENIKKNITDKKVHGKAITLYQGLYIQFSHLLFSEVLLLLILRILKLGILPEITPPWAFGNDFSSFQAVC